MLSSGEIRAPNRIIKYVILNHCSYFYVGCRRDHNFKFFSLSYITNNEQWFIAVDMTVFFGALISSNDGFLFLSLNLLSLKLHSNVMYNLVVIDCLYPLTHVNLCGAC